MVLRMANVMLTMALGWMLSLLVIRLLWTAGWPHVAVLSARIVSLALCQFRLGNTRATTHWPFNRS